MFWKKDRMERATDGAKFAVVFMIVIAISSLILNAPPPDNTVCRGMHLYSFTQ